LPVNPKGMETTAQICCDDAMERGEAISRLQRHEADLKRLGVEHLYMFGSTARGDAGDDSDVDLFFDYERASSASLS
jgi:predicted nucleotidyltransferase